MAKSKAYELMLKICGKADSSLKAACSAAQKDLTTLGNAAKSAGKVVSGASAAIAGATAAIGAAALKSGGEYQAQLANISTLLTGTEAEVAARTAEIGAQVLDVSNRTGVANDNLTDGMYQVISAFGDTKDAVNILEVAAKSAAAGNADTADSINLLSAVTKGYGDTSAAAVQKAADLSFATVRLGQTSFPELAASMGKVIPLASTLGLEQEQLFGAMSTLTGVTGSTAEVVTQLKATMQGFLSPSKNMQAALSSMGYESGQALLESKGLQGALEALKGSVHGDELAFAGLFSSVEAQTAVLAMAGAQSENLAGKTAEMYEAVGAADTAFQRQTNNMKYTIQTVKNLGKNFLIQLGTNMLPYVNDLAESAIPKVQKALESAASYVENPLIPTAEKAAKWLYENRKAILAVAAGAATAVGAFKGLKTASAAVGAVKNLSTVFKAATQGGGLLSKVLGMGSVKIALIAGAAALLAAGFVYLWNKSERFRETVSGILAKLQPLLQAFLSLASAAGSQLAPMLEFVGTALLNGLDAAIVVLGPTIENIIGMFTGLLNFISGVFSGDWEKAWQGICDIFKNLFSGLANIAKVPINAVIGAINSVVGAINQCGFTIPNWVPVVGGKNFSINLPQIPMLATGGIVTAPTILEAGEGGEPEAILPLSKLAAMLDAFSGKGSPENRDRSNLPAPDVEWPDDPDPADKPPSPKRGGGPSPKESIVYAPVFNFHGNTGQTKVKEAARLSFQEFKKMWRQLQDEDRRKNLQKA